MVDAVSAFILIGAILFTGFIATLVFQRTGLPDTLLLVLLGLFIGPYLGVVQAGDVNGVVQFFSALALIVLLFTGGLQLNIYNVVFHLKKAAVFSLFSYALTSLAVAAVSFVAFGLDPMRSLFLGVVLGGTCSAIMGVLASKIRGEEENKPLLLLEATMTEAVSIVFAIAIIQMLVSRSVDFSATLNSIASAFSVAIVVGAIVGVAWLGVLRDVRIRPFGYLLTLAAAFVLYGAVELARGNGAISALVFGLVLGNAPEISSFLKLEWQFELDRTIRQFQGEMAFFVRTFFFVYLGLNFAQPVEWQVPVFALMIVAAIVASRAVAARVLLKPKSAKSSRLYALLVPRGLAAAVLASLPLSNGLAFPHIFEIVLIVIVATDLLAAGGAFLHGLKPGEQPKPGHPPASRAPPTPRRGPKIVGYR